MKLCARLTAAALAAVMMISMSGCCCTNVLPGGVQNLIPSKCDHVWSPATCQSPAVCIQCGETEGEAIDHQYVGITCAMCGVQMELVTDPTSPDYRTVTVTGQYGDNVKLPMLSDAKVTMMMSIDWSYLEMNNDPEDPFSQYYATLLWREAYGAQGGDVEIITISDEQQTDYLATQSASGTAPDILPANYDMTYPRWSAMGLTAPVTQYADYLGLNETNPNDSSKTLYNLDLTTELFQWDGEPHAVISANSADRNYIVYNKTKFLQAGQTTPLDLWEDGKWNWTNFVKTAQAMTNKTEYGFTGWGLFPYFAPYPMATVDENGDVSLAIDDSRYMRYMTEVYQLYQVKKAARCDFTLQSWTSLFPSGQDAMVQTTLSGYKRIVQASERIDGDEFGIAPVPVFDPAGETESISSATVWGYAIAAEAQNPVGAANYIRLETLVARNIQNTLNEMAWYEEHMTDAELAMLEETENDPVCLEMIRGIGDCYLNIIDSTIVPELYYGPTKNPVQKIFDSQRTALEAEFDEFNDSLH